MLDKRLNTLLIIFALMANPSYSEEDDDEAFSMSLGDILNLELSVASFRPEKITETPAIVSSFSPQQLKAFGIRDIKELLGFFPGFLIEKGLLGFPNPLVRGAAESSGRNVLFMIDGVPVWSSFSGYPPIVETPFSAIDKVEVIRGPGAVIYGTNAIAAVINVITKTKDGGAATIHLDSNRKSVLRGNYSHKFDNEVRVGVAFETQNDVGYSGEIFNSPDNRADIDYFEQPTSALVTIENESFKFLVHQFRNRVNGKQPANPDFSVQGDLRPEGLLISAAYKVADDDSIIDAYIDYNSIGIDGTYPLVQEVSSVKRGEGTYRVRAGIKGTWTLSEDFYFLGGVESERRTADAQESSFILPSVNFPFTEIETVPSQLEGETDENSVFAQIDYTLDSFRFLLGARFVDNSLAGSNVSPRATLVYNIDENQSIKVLYGQGFSSPAFNQTGISVPTVIRGNSDLEAETIDSFDIAYTRITENSLFIFNLFRYTGDNFIVVGLATDPAATEPLTFLNSPEFSHQGAELDFQTAFDDWTIFSNLSYVEEGNSIQPDDPFAVFIPEIIANVGVSYTSGKHTFGGNIRYISERQGVDTMARLDLAYTYAGDTLEYYATVKNATGEEQYTPDIGSFTDIILERGYRDAYVEFGLRSEF